MKDMILLVDDENHILESYKRHLFEDYKIVTASNGKEGLSKLTQFPDISVIVSDMQMPEMDGLEFLEEARYLNHGAIRIMLTGNSDQKTASEAINRADVFKFLNKPCAPHDLKTALLEAISERNVRNKEHEVLNSTLRNSINTLVEVLSLSCPEAFGSINRIKSSVILCLRHMNSNPDWMVESLPMLAFLGYISLPSDILKKVSRGAPLTDDQRSIYNTHADVGHRLIKAIPRLGGIAKSVLYQNKGYDGSGYPDDEVSGKSIPTGARLLKVALDYEYFLASTTPDQALQRLLDNRSIYDLTILKNFVEAMRLKKDDKILTIEDSELRIGMVVAADVYTNEGILLIAKGQDVSDGVISRYLNFKKHYGIAQPLSIYSEK